MKIKTSPILMTFVLVCLGFLPKLHAVNPPPDGGYPGGNTAEGQSALLSRTTGIYNTGIGIYSLLSVTTGSFNTAIGAGALLSQTGNENTATGAGALLNDQNSVQNTANGAFALFSNTNNNANTATGYQALFQNNGGANTANGWRTLYDNTTGSSNTAIGERALSNNTTGSNNTVVGSVAGNNITTANNVICIGTGVFGSNTDNTCYIGNIFNQSSPSGTAVFVNSDGKLGTTVSSQRFKDDIKPMDKTSEAILALKPVTFRYKKEFDPTGIAQFGLVAEDVGKVNPDLVVRDKQGKPYSVRYDQVNAMLVNEFLKEHRKVEEQACEIEQHKAKISKLEKAMETIVAHSKEQDAQIQRVGDQVQMSSAERRTVASKQ